MKPSVFLSSSLVSLFVLSACGKAPVAPVINFIGVGTGTLVSDVNKIHFNQTFTTKERQLIAVVSFANIENGSTVQATWFSPDERSIPLGRTPIVTQSGAHIARFSFASQVDWKPAPYQLRIDVQTNNGKTPLTTSGSLHFFIGMKDAEIQEYAKNYTAWMQHEEKMRAEDSKQVAAEEALATKAKAALGTTGDLAIALRKDLNGDGKNDYLFVPADNPDAGTSDTPGVLFSSRLSQFVIVNGSGSLVLMMQKSGQSVVIQDAAKKQLTKIQSADPVSVVMLPSLTVSLSWQDKKKACTQELRHTTGSSFTAAPQTCQ